MTTALSHWVRRFSVKLQSLAVSIAPKRRRTAGRQQVLPVISAEAPLSPPPTPRAIQEPSAPPLVAQPTTPEEISAMPVVDSYPASPVGQAVEAVRQEISEVSEIPYQNPSQAEEKTHIGDDSPYDKLPVAIAPDIQVNSLISEELFSVFSRDYEDVDHDPENVIGVIDVPPTAVSLPQITVTIDDDPQADSVTALVACGKEVDFTAEVEVYPPLSDPKDTEHTALQPFENFLDFDTAAQWDFAPVPEPVAPTSAPADTLVSILQSFEENLDSSDTALGDSTLSSEPQTPFFDVVDGSAQLLQSIDAEPDSDVPPFADILRQPGVIGSTPATRRRTVHSEEELAFIQREKARRRFNLQPLEEPSSAQVTDFVQSLAAGTLNDSLSIDQIELLLRGALHQVDLIGELPVSRDAFQQLCAVLRSRFAGPYGQPTLKNARCPALFVTAMVFCARYSDENARNFWTPYANLIWHRSTLDEYLRRVCAQFFQASRIFLADCCNIHFSVLNSGDVVRPVFRHAILPYYLQNDLADWLVKHLDEVARIPFDHWQTALAEINSLQYLPPRLRQFVLDEDTAETAYDLVQRMKRALDAFNEGEDAELINQQLASSIEQSVWVYLVQALTSADEPVRNARQRRPYLEWVWSLESDDLCLRLTNVTIRHEAGKPERCVWLDESTSSNRREEVREYVHPWDNADGWLLDEVLLSGAASPGQVLILSEDDDILYRETVPPIPEAPMSVFRLTGERQYAAWVDHRRPLADGDWLLSLADGITLEDQQGQSLVPRERLEPPELLRDSVRHVYAGQYELHFPVIVRQASRILTTLEKLPTSVGEPFLEGKHPLSDIAPDAPPVFCTSDIRLHLPGIGGKIHRLTLSLSANAFQCVYRLDELLQSGTAVWEGDELIVAIGQLLPTGNASYKINLRRDLHSVLSAPLRFSILSGIAIVAPEQNVLFSPTNRPTVTLAAVLEDVEVGAEGTKELFGDAVRVTWNQLDEDTCRLRLHFGLEAVLLSWRIRRVSAWISRVDEDIVLPDNVQQLSIHARGERYGRLRWLLQSIDQTEQRDLSLNAQGRYDRLLVSDALYDMLKLQSGITEVFAEANGMRWQVFTYHGQAVSHPRQADTPEVIPIRISQSPKPKLEDQLAAVRARTAMAPRREKMTVSPTLARETDLVLISHLREAVQAGKTVALSADDYWRLATMPVATYQQASLSELSAIWNVLADLAEVYRLDNTLIMEGFPDQVVDRRFTENQLQVAQGKYSRAPHKLTTVEGYRFAADDWISDLKARRDQQKKLVSKPFGRANLRGLYTKLNDLSRIPLVVETGHLLNTVRNETEYQSQLLKLDEVVLLLALLLRMHAYYPLSIPNTGVEKREAQAMLALANEACPALLRWSLTWVELLYFTSQSHRYKE